jgi:hypothetical protein
MSTKIQNRVFTHTPLHGFSGLRISLFAFLMLFSVTMFGQFNVQSSYEVGKDDSLTYKAPNNIGSIKEVVWWVSGTLGTSVVGHIEQQPAAFNRTFDFSNNPISVATFNSSHNELNFRFGDAASNLELVQIDIHYIDAAGDNRQFHKEEWVTVNTITPPTI